MVEVPVPPQQAEPTDKVVDFAQAKLERSPHSTGEAKCLGCGDEWVAVAPLGTTWLDCGKCGEQKGVFKYRYGPSDEDLELACNCGHRGLFEVCRKPSGNTWIMCPMCGTNQFEAMMAPYG